VKEALSEELVAEARSEVTAINTQGASSQQDPKIIPSRRFFRSRVERSIFNSVVTYLTVCCLRTHGAVEALSARVVELESKGLVEAKARAQEVASASQAVAAAAEASLTAAREELAAAQAQLKDAGLEAEAKVAKLRASLSAAQSEAGACGKRLTVLSWEAEDEVKKATARAEDLAAGLDAAREKLGAAQAAQAEAGQLAEELASARAQAEASAVALVTAEAEAARLEVSLEDARSDLVAVKALSAADATTCSGRAATAEAQAKALTAALAACEAEAARLEASLSKALAEAAAARTMSAADASTCLERTEALRAEMDAIATASDASAARASAADRELVDCRGQGRLGSNFKLVQYLNLARLLASPACCFSVSNI